jgi:hypothetical protein
LTRAPAPLSRNDRRAEPGTPPGQRPGRPNSELTPKSTGVPDWLSSLFGGDSRDATPANLLLTGRFQATALASKVAHSCEASVRAHSAGLPWPAGDPLSQTPRSTTSTGTRQATTHRQQNPPAHGHNRPRALCREPQDLAACDRASAPIAGSDRPGDGGIQQQASSRQRPDSPPNRPESRSFSPQGRDDAFTLLAEDNLAESLRAQGNLAEALARHENIVMRAFRSLGPTHQVTLTTVANWADTLRQLGCRRAGYDMHRQVLIHRLRTLGEAHHETLSSFHNTALALAELGDNVGALEMYQTAYRVTCEAMGELHHDTLTALHNLCETALFAGETELAVEFTNTLCRGLRQTLPSNHVLVLRARELFVWAQFVGGANEAAKREADRLVHDAESSLPAGHALLCRLRHALKLTGSPRGRSFINADDQGQDRRMAIARTVLFAEEFWAKRF